MTQIALLASGILMLQTAFSPIPGANAAQAKPAGEITGFVVPNQVGANEPFTFGATNVVEGEVIQVKTVEGEVVQTKKADKLGRVFLPAGLAAGAYLLSTQSGKSASNLNVQPPRALPVGNGLTIPQVPGCFDSKQGLSLMGEGMSPNAADMAVKIGKTNFPVLAGTATEMKTGPLPPGACGEGPVQITNNKTGDTSMLDSVVCYELSAKIARQTIAGGQQTNLEFTFKPANFSANVIVQILSGPVSFPGGAKSQDFMVVGGKGKLPLKADPAGQGPFRVAYDINEILGAGKTAGSTYLPMKGAGVGGLGEGAAGGAGQAGGTASGLGGAAAGAGQLGGGHTGDAQKGEKVDNKKKRCPKTKHIRDEANGWTQTEKEVPDPKNPGKTKKVYIISRTVRCSIYKSCSKDEGHSGDCVFTGKSRCQDHDIVETREFDTEQERKDSMKDTKIPDDLKYPK